MAFRIMVHFLGNAFKVFHDLVSQLHNLFFLYFTPSLLQLISQGLLSGGKSV